MLRHLRWFREHCVQLGIGELVDCHEIALRRNAVLNINTKFIFISYGSFLDVFDFFRELTGDEIVPVPVFNTESNLAAKKFRGRFFDCLKNIRSKTEFTTSN